MQASRRTFRSIVLALVALSLCACHFHGHRCGGFRYHAPIRVCR